MRAELAAYSYAVMRKRPSSVRSLIFAQGRTGSTLLESLLASTAHFEERGELLAEDRGDVTFPSLYLRGLARLRPCSNFICHVKIYHLTNRSRPVDPHEFLRSLHRDGWKIIHLSRRDKLQHYVSGCLARARGGYHKKNDAAEPTQIVIERAALEQGMANRRARDAEERAALIGVPHYPLVYEDALAEAAHHQATIDGVLDFLGLERRPASSSLKKINVPRGTDPIRNRVELEQWARELAANFR